ncbi:MAG: cobalamin B12-binding domain-containing protein [Chloroflexota bacterium]
MVANTPPLLIVAVDPLLRGLITQLLQEWGLQSVEAGSVSELLDRLAASDYSLAIVEYLEPAHPQRDLWPVFPILQRLAPQLSQVALYSDVPPPDGPQLLGRVPLSDAATRLRGMIESHARHSVGPPHNPRLALYLKSLWLADVDAALALADDALREGATLEEVFDGLLAAALNSFGEWWAAGACRVADEHGARTITEEVMIRTFAKQTPAHLTGREAILACVPGERHEIGLEMFSLPLRLRGWTLHCLGADTPIQDLLRLSERRQPDLVGISATIPPDQSTLRHTIATLRQSPKTRVILGGSGFSGKEQAIQLGADGYGATSSEGIAMVEQLVGRA